MRQNLQLSAPTVLTQDDTALRRVLDAQTVRVRSTLPVRTDEIYPRTIAVVVDRSFDAAAVDIERGAQDIDG
jgi:hypothetical protein